MENKRLIIVFAAGFSIVFSIVYYFLFSMTLTSGGSEKRTLYMNQVGLYQKQESIDGMKTTLKEAGFVGYTLKQGELSAVVCSVSLEEASTKKEQEKLKAKNFSYIQKSVSVEDPEIIKLIDQKEFDKALERIGK